MMVASFLFYRCPGITWNILIKEASRGLFQSNYLNTCAKAGWSWKLEKDDIIKANNWKIDN